jgi:hypothetical protein
VAAERVDDLLVGRIGPAAQQLVDRHDEARRAEAALEPCSSRNACWIGCSVARRPRPSTVMTSRRRLAPRA